MRAFQTVLRYQERWDQLKIEGRNYQQTGEDQRHGAQKVGEEGVEVALAAVAETKEDLLGECADLFYHTLVLLQDQNIEMSEVMAILQKRHNK